MAKTMQIHMKALVCQNDYSVTASGSSILVQYVLKASGKSELKEELKLTKSYVGWCKVVSIITSYVSSFFKLLATYNGFWKNLMRLISNGGLSLFSISMMISFS